MDATLPQLNIHGQGNDKRTGHNIGQRNPPLASSRDDALDRINRAALNTNR
jgi:hypothetical protein